MGEPSTPAPAAVWYITVSKEASGEGGWLLRVSMTTSVEGGIREDRYVADIDAAALLLRSWFERVSSGAH